MCKTPLTYNPFPDRANTSEAQKGRRSTSMTTKLPFPPATFPCSHVVLDWKGMIYRVDSRTRERRNPVAGARTTQAQIVPFFFSHFVNSRVSDFPETPQSPGHTEITLRFFFLGVFVVLVFVSLLFAKFDLRGAL